MHAYLLGYLTLTFVGALAHLFDDPEHPITAAIAAVLATAAVIFAWMVL